MSSSRFDEPERESPGFALWHLTREWERRLSLALRPYDITHPQFVLLACAYWLSRSGPSPTQVEIARQAGLDPKAVSPVLRRLESAGLIGRATHTADSRAHQVTVTEAGVSLAQQTIAIVESADQEFFAQLPKGFDRAVLEGSARLRGT